MSDPSWHETWTDCQIIFLKSDSINAKVGDEEEREKVGEKSDLKKGRNPGRRRRNTYGS